MRVADASSTALPSESTELVLDVHTKHQTIRAFGASDAWSVQFVGAGWPEETRRAMAERLFSTELGDDRSPKGIGLNSWRFNIGAGSIEQGAASDIPDEWRRAECFLAADGSYDFEHRHVGQMWFMQEAARLGVSKFTGFVNSPPVHMTRNGKAFSSGGMRANLALGRYRDFADFLATVVEGVKARTGVEFTYISPVNETQWEWVQQGETTQEGSPWLNAEVAALVRLLNETFLRRGIKTKIELTEAARMDFLYRFNPIRAGRSDQLRAFYCGCSPYYVADLPCVAGKSVSAHGYFTTWTTRDLAQTRRALRAAVRAQGPDMEFWMSEYTLLENNRLVRGCGRDLGMNPAMYLARVLHADLVLADASTWHWWLAVSPYDYKDGLLYTDGKNKSGGRFFESKMLWAYGNFSRFIRAGMRRVGVRSRAGIEENWEGLLASAYLGVERLVVVMVNEGEGAHNVRLSGIPEGYYLMSVYRTSQDESLRLVSEQMAAESVPVPRRSVVTCVIT